MKSSPCVLQLGKDHTKQQGPAQPKFNKNTKNPEDLLTCYQKNVWEIETPNMTAKFQEWVKKSYH